MQTIGEQLEEARKHKGISLREASEATKIRIDFLENIEKNLFDFELPEIYKRGFIKNYANYLSLDSKSLLTNYDSQLKEISSSRKTIGSEFFGSVDLNPVLENTGKTQLGKISANTKAVEINEVDQQDTEVDKSFYVKTGLVVLGVLSFVVILLGLIAAVLSSDDEQESEIAAVKTPPVATTASRDTNLETPSSSPEKVSLLASGNVYVLVKQRNDNKELVRKTLGAGEELEFTKQGPIDILFTAGENLVIVNADGKRLRPKGEGTAKISIP